MAISEKIRHCVFLEFKAEYSYAQQIAIFRKLAALKPQINGFISMTFGKNIDIEDKSNCNAGFTIDFENRRALDCYASHDMHKKLGAELVNMCVNGSDSIIVFDLILEKNYA